MQFTRLRLHKALPMVTSVLAEAIGLTRKGVIRPGADAEIILLNNNLEVTQTIVGGALIYRTHYENSQI